MEEALRRQGFAVHLLTPRELVQAAAGLEGASDFDFNAFEIAPPSANPFEGGSFVAGGFDGGDDGGDDYGTSTVAYLPREEPYDIEDEHTDDERGGVARLIRNHREVAFQYHEAVASHNALVASLTTAFSPAGQALELTQPAEDSRADRSRHKLLTDYLEPEAMQDYGNILRIEAACEVALLDWRSANLAYEAAVKHHSRVMHCFDAAQRSHDFVVAQRVAKMKELESGRKTPKTHAARVLELSEYVEMINIHALPYSCGCSAGHSAVVVEESQSSTWTFKESWRPLGSHVDFLPPGRPPGVGYRRPSAFRVPSASSVLSLCTTARRLESDCRAAAEQLMQNDPAFFTTPSTHLSIGSRIKRCATNNFESASVLTGVADEVVRCLKCAPLLRFETARKEWSAMTLSFHLRRCALLAFFDDLFHGDEKQQDRASAVHPSGAATAGRQQAAQDAHQTPNSRSTRQEDDSTASSVSAGAALDTTVVQQALSPPPEDPLRLARQDDLASSRDASRRMCIVQAAFDGQGDSRKLPVAKNDILEILQEDDEGWLNCRKWILRVNDGFLTLPPSSDVVPSEGFVPRDYIHQACFDGGRPGMKGSEFIVWYVAQKRKSKEAAAAKKAARKASPAHVRS